MSICLLLLIHALIGSTLQGQNEQKLIRKGNAEYDEKLYKEAEINYRKALEKNKESFKGQFNLGDAIYQQNNFGESSRIFSSIAEKTKNKNEQANVYHNLGNSLLQEKKYAESIDAYKKALLKNPKDEDTRYNLAYAQSMLRQQQQQQQQQQNKQDQKDKQQQDQQKQDQQQQDNQDQQQKKQQDKPKISKQDAERMLEALKNKERKTQEKMKKVKAAGERTTTEIDW
ncbi:MAG: tetratricopeptide repeat protein [Bacteroidetes bacterium]|nr:tetratricopeptide repeat protein [Bacteroidota bacterium]